MDHNGSVSGPPLYHEHLLNDVNDGTGGGAQTLRGPARHLELGHLVHLTRLQDRRQEVLSEQGLSSDTECGSVHKHIYSKPTIGNN